MYVLIAILLIVLAGKHLAYRLIVTSFLSLNVKYLFW